MHRGWWRGRRERTERTDAASHSHHILYPVCNSGRAAEDIKIVTQSEADAKSRCLGVAAGGGEWGGRDHVFGDEIAALLI